MEVAPQRDHAAGDLESFVDLRSGVPCGTRSEETGEAVRIPVTVPDPASVIEDAPRHGVAFGFGSRAVRPELADLLLQWRREFLVRIEDQDPIVSGVGEREVALADVAQPVLMEPSGSEAGCDFGGGVVTSGIDDDDLVDQTHRALEASREVGLLVLRDEDAGDLHPRTAG